MIEISIVIPTFRRPALLQQALASCRAQTGIAPGTAEVVIVDNCPAGTARATVEAAASAAAAGLLPVRYVAEPRPGISHARNTGIAAAAGRLIAFLDDDETADPGWLAALVETQRRTGADVVFGPVVAVLEAPPASHAAFRKGFYSRDAGVETGRAVRYSGTGNSLHLRERCFTDAQPFDPTMGLTGSEDTLFFAQLARRGARFVWCREAVVWEAVPADRVRLPVIWRRAFRGGQAVSMVCARTTPPARLRLAGWMTVGVLQVALLGPLALLLWAVGVRQAPALTVKALGGLGKVLWMRRFWPQRYGDGPDPRYGTGRTGAGLRTVPPRERASPAVPAALPPLDRR